MTRPKRAASAPPRPRWNCASAPFPPCMGKRPWCGCSPIMRGSVDLDGLGFAAEMAAELRELLVETSGAILVTGPAGSGKTTTLYACLHEICRADRRPPQPGLAGRSDRGGGRRRRPVAGQPGGRLRPGRRAPLFAASGSGSDHGRRDPRRRHGRSRLSGIADRASGAQLVSRRQRRRRHQSLVRHGHRPLPAAQRHPGDRLAAPGPQVVPLRSTDRRRRRIAWPAGQAAPGRRLLAASAAARVTEAACCWPKC